MANNNSGMDLCNGGMDGNDGQLMALMWPPMQQKQQAQATIYNLDS